MRAEQAGQAGQPGQAARDPSLLSIGEVLAQLRTEFPDTTISKLRFLETEGLVQPQRTPSGYRKYSPEDVARLRYVLAAQRDQYLPLRVIRQQLDEGAHVQAPTRPTLVAVTDDFVPEEPSRVHRDELLTRAGIDAALLADLERHGLVTARAGDWFDSDAVTVAEVAGRLAAYGIQPRHLRPYRAAADREAGLFAQVVAPMLRQHASLRDTGDRRDLASRARADEALRELMLLSQRLHLALLRLGLDETLGH
ncbi:MerR family transcriptional regulator [Allorhizocola rhizosphaerae]|uniref:transcriptional regulator FtsR n=1 Tax=Allorhizocola rhizosphaerae TaxID=1872709 RepID=UPI001FEB5109|nr:MerR family transcriptional regulator [Allorhizocola rhizosphaerae]